MIAKLKIPTLLAVALFSVSCVDGYGAGDYEDDDDETEEEEDDDKATDKGSVNAGDSGWKDAGTSAWSDAGKSGDNGWDAGKGDSGASSSADGGKWADAGADAGKDAGRGDASAGGSCSELTYETFGEEFLTTYCVGCHGASSPRGNVTLTSLANVVQKKAGIKAAVLNGNMPQGTKKPTEEERQQFGQWIDCGPK